MTTELARRREPLLFALTLALVLWWSSGFRNALVWGSFAVLAWRPDLRRVRLRESPPLAISCAMLVWTLASVMYSENPALSARDWIKNTEGIVAAWVLAQMLARPERLERTLWHLFVACALVFAFDGATFLLHVVREGEWIERWAPPPRFLHANVYSGLVVAVLPLGLLPVLRHRLNRARAWTIGLATSSGLLLLVAFASRTAQIALVGVFATLAVLQRSGARALTVTALVVLALAVPALNPRFTDATMGTLSNRLENWAGTSSLIGDSPWLGYGFGDRTYFEVYGRHYPDRTEPYPHAHNLYLRLWFGSGLPGFLLQLALQISLFTALWRRIRRAGPLEEQAVPLVLLLSATGLFVFSLADIPTGPLAFYSWFLVGAVAAACAPGRDARGTSLARSS